MAPVPAGASGCKQRVDPGAPLSMSNLIPGTFHRFTIFISSIYDPFLSSSQHPAQPSPFRQHRRNRHRARPSRRRNRFVHVPFAFLLHDLTKPASDRLRWYCKNSSNTSPTIIREEAFHVTDLGSQLKPFIQRWMEDEEVRRCAQCGVVADAK